MSDEGIESRGKCREERGEGRSVEEVCSEQARLFEHRTSAFVSFELAPSARREDKVETREQRNREEDEAGVLADAAVPSYKLQKNYSRLTSSIRGVVEGEGRILDQESSRSMINFDLLLIDFKLWSFFD